MQLTHGHGRKLTFTVMTLMSACHMFTRKEMATHFRSECSSLDKEGRLTDMSPVAAEYTGVVKLSLQVHST